MLPETVYTAAPIMQDPLWAKMILWLVGIFFGSIFGMIVLTIVAGIIDMFLKLFPRIFNNFSLLDWLADHSFLWVEPATKIKYTNYDYYNSYNYYTPTPQPEPKPKKPPKAMAFGRLDGISYEKEGPEEPKFTVLSEKSKQTPKIKENKKEVNKEIAKLIEKYKKPKAKWKNRAKNTCKWLQNHKYFLISMILFPILTYISIKTLPMYLTIPIVISELLTCLVMIDKALNRDKWV
jgi:hypothetical protein